ncbi:uncharacterized protein LOC141612917 [Silene latifolia]|uniref:uncharacterized protein LOC141612917 n=1 Tax=Silene latifolia TaxID=37657 RepID=UPI003D7766FD
MQDHQSLTAAGFPQLKIQFPEHEQLRCPRCDSANTKFCYYNNYNLSQPRHFCKNCRRYWTKGGTLRNIPVGGGCRKTNKRPAPAADSNSSKQLQLQQRVVQTQSASSVPSSGSGSGLNYSQPQNPTLKIEPGPILGPTSVGTGSGVSKESNFTSLLGLATNGQFGNFINRSNDGSGQNTGLDVLQGSGNSSEGFMLHGLQNGSDTNCWASNNNGWPDLAINTSGFKLQ